MQRQQEVLDIVIRARDTALNYLEDAHNQGSTVLGWQADQVAREYIGSRGYGEYFTHRIIPGICFSIEPGIYLPEFGVRSEIDVFMSADGPYASSPVQHEVVLIKGG